MEGGGGGTGLGMPGREASPPLLSAEEEEAADSEGETAPKLPSAILACEERSGLPER